MTTPEQRIEIARIVAEHWRKEEAKAVRNGTDREQRLYGMGVQALAEAVLAALSGEADPMELLLFLGPDADRIRSIAGR